MLRQVQSRGESMLEAGTNVAFGYFLAIATQAVIYPVFGIRTTFATDASLAAVFTCVSLLRSYIVRRAFEAYGRRSSAGRLFPPNKRTVA
jgi:hypothetical protein